MSTPMNDDKSASKRPKDTKFKQQKLPAWQPIMTAGTVLPAFFAIGIAFIPLGVALLITSDNVQEVIVDYTLQCKPLGGQKDASMYSSCRDFLAEKNNTGKTCKCAVNFTLTEDFRGQVYMYYGLTNFYQNHRRYVKSRDDNQLLGKVGEDLTSDCQPYRNINDTVYIAPCGAIANSLFNDSLKIDYNQVKDDETVLVTVPLIKKGIAWTTDKSVKFANPPGDDLKEAFKDYVHPPNWQKNIWELDPEDPSNNGYENEDLIVWMRTAALPTFRKLYRKVNQTGLFVEGLRAGNYTLNVDYNYPVSAFDGTKKMILTTTSWLGGKNPFLGIAYLVVGSFCIVLGIVFLVIHIRVGKRHEYDVYSISRESQLQDHQPQTYGYGTGS